MLKNRNEELNGYRRRDWSEPRTCHRAHLIQCAICKGLGTTMCRYQHDQQRESRREMGEKHTSAGATISLQ